jgi:hypothetical protein
MELRCGLANEERHYSRGRRRARRDDNTAGDGHTRAVNPPGGSLVMPLPRRLLCVVAVFAGVLAALPAVAQEEGDAEGDRHAGYYFPEPQSEETYKARAVALPDSDRSRRLAFVTILTQQQLNAPYPPSLALFAKGEEAEKLILVGLRDGPMDTLYRARGVLAMLTASARSSELFKQYQVQDIFTFLDLLRLLGFERLTLSDGKTWAHVIYIE